VQAHRARSAARQRASTSLLRLQLRHAVFHRSSSRQCWGLSGTRGSGRDAEAAKNLVDCGAMPEAPALEATRLNSLFGET